MRSIQLIGVAAGLGGLLTLLLPRPADACGGTFCDAGQGPQAMPVDQTGETIVFVVDGDRVEAHIQIEYDPDTDAEQFAWIIPVFGQPEFSVGSQQLFLNLQNATVPSYGFVNNFQACGGGGDGDWDDWDDYGCDGGGAGGTGDAAGDEGQAGDDGGTTGGGTEVLLEETIGAFDIVVLESQTSDDLMTWLGDNDFFQDPAAEPILQEYIDEGATFAAVRLTTGAGVGEIHPITLAYEGSEPCVPIRLTRIAAQDDMAIRLFFLSNERVYPSNYRHVELNPLKLDWANLAANYDEVVSMAIDEPLVDGHGFVTEFAGSSDLVPRDQLFSESWHHTAFQDADVLEVPELLRTQGLIDCSEEADCTGHPLIFGLLDAYLPVPEGVNRADFYACVHCYEEETDLSLWDGPAFALALRERILGPGRHAVEILDAYPQVTRLYTRISPHEMTVDPMFHETEGPSVGVDNTSLTGTRDFACGGAVEMQLPAGRDVRLVTQSAWPDIAPEEMPWAETITEHMPGVAPVTLADNSSQIDTLLDAWNTGMQTSNSSFCGDDSDTGYDGGVLASCRCRTGDDDQRYGWMLMLLGLLGLRRLRRGR